MRLLVYDATWLGRAWVQPGLTSSWIVGGALYRGLGRIDASYGATSWEDALAWLCSVEPSKKVDEIQFWGHGTWGRVLIGRDRLDADAVKDRSHSRHGDLKALRERLTGPQALMWFRSCETFGREAGHHFASAWTRFFGCRVAGYTYVIGPWQSGLHSLAPGQTPSWSVAEGLPVDVAEPRHARMSGPLEPNTISCLHGRIPDGF
jgi:hypothetical protein